MKIITLTEPNFSLVPGLSPLNGSEESLGLTLAWSNTTLIYGCVLLASSGRVKQSLRAQIKWYQVQVTTAVSLYFLTWHLTCQSVENGHDYWLKYRWDFGCPHHSWRGFNSFV